MELIIREQKKFSDEFIVGSGFAAEETQSQLRMVVGRMFVSDSTDGTGVGPREWYEL